MHAEAVSPKLALASEGGPLISSNCESMFRRVIRVPPDTDRGLPAPKRLARSESDPARHYVGLTGNIENRLDWHNAGPSGHTVDHRPWSLVVVLEFLEEQTAVRFERYLKSGSGRAFAKRHFTADQRGE